MFGAPNLLQKTARAVALTLLGNAVTRFFNYLTTTPPWGVYLPGTTQKAFEVSSVTELGVSGEASISDYMIETGSFATYNKVQMPDVFAIRLTRDGSEAVRGAFLGWLQVSKNSLTTFDILCPENTYQNATLKSYRVTRSAESGAAMIIADCVFQQVREKPAIYSITKITAPQNQPSTPTARVSPITVETVPQGFPD